MVRRGRQRDGQARGRQGQLALVVNDQMLGFETHDARATCWAPPTARPARRRWARRRAPTPCKAANETLESIARACGATAKLWYLLADANGLGHGEELQLGHAAARARRASTRCTTTMAPSSRTARPRRWATPRRRCRRRARRRRLRHMGTLIMIAVAVVVTIYTAGATGRATSARWPNGAALRARPPGDALPASLPLAAGGAVGGAAGSIASQAVGMAIGAQDGFSWKGVAMSARSAARCRAAWAASTWAASTPRPVERLPGRDRARGHLQHRRAGHQHRHRAAGRLPLAQRRRCRRRARRPAQAFSGSTALSAMLGDSEIAQGTVERLRRRPHLVRLPGRQDRHR